MPCARIRLVLVGVEGPVNLGFIARLADNFGVDEFYLVDPRASVEQARRFAARAAGRLDSAVIAGSLGEALEGVSLAICTSAVAREEDPLRAAVAPWEAAWLASLHEGTVALVMGRESTGLTREELELCDLLSTIPTGTDYPTLNVSNATAIYLYELRRACTAGPPRPPAAPRAELDRLYDAAARLARALGGGERLTRAARVARNLAARAGASRWEAATLAYLLSKAARRAGAGSVEGAADG